MDTAWAHGSSILFGQMYEDAAIEQRVFPEGARVFCIASAGCTAITLSTSHAVTAVDINAAQLDYAKRRAQGALSRPGFIERALRCGALAAGWRSVTLHEFVNLKDTSEQLAFWQRRLNTLRFRIVFAAAISPAAFAFSRFASPSDPLPRDFAAVLRGRMERGFAT